MAGPTFDYFDYGRQQAGKGWYKPGGESQWATVLAGLMQGLGRGAPSALRAYGQYRLKADEAIPRAGAPGEFTPYTGPDTPYAEAAPGEIQAATPEMAARTPTIGQPQDKLTREQRLRYLRMYLQSSRTLKDNITRADERRSLREVLATPTYRYRYLDEPEGTQSRIGPMAEEVPARWQTPDGHGIKMPVYLGALHAATRALARDVRSLKEQLRA